MWIPSEPKQNTLDVALLISNQNSAGRVALFGRVRPEDGFVSNFVTPVLRLVFASRLSPMHFCRGKLQRLRAFASYLRRCCGLRSTRIALFEHVDAPVNLTYFCVSLSPRFTSNIYRMSCCSEQLFHCTRRMEVSPL